MATVRLNCPHCGRIDRLSVSSPLAQHPDVLRPPWLADVPLGRFGFDAVSALKCHLCGGWSIGVFTLNGTEGSQLLSTGLEAGQPVEGSERAELLAAFPAPPSFDAHPAVPEEAATFFVEAKEDLRSGRSAAGVISKCRSVLDLSLKQLDAVGAGRKARIADLRAKGILTQGLADWAGRLWDDGNDAIHDLRGDHERAKQHVTFLELFFDVAFALPAQVAAAQESGAA